MIAFSYGGFKIKSDIELKPSRFKSVQVFHQV